MSDQVLNIKVAFYSDSIRMIPIIKQFDIRVDGTEEDLPLFAVSISVVSQNFSLALSLVSVRRDRRWLCHSDTNLLSHFSVFLVP
jgi:hypothetical protein